MLGKNNRNNRNNKDNKDDSIILEHYKKVAHNFGLSANSAMQDPHIKETEIKFFIASINQFIEREERWPFILDIGCGNGHTLEVLTHNFPFAHFGGIEFSPELYHLAHSRKLPNAKIIQGDIRISPLWEHPVDIIITERVIINLLKPHEQRKALSNIAKTLSPLGEYLMSESFLRPWQRLNHSRKEMGLPAISQSKHNLYLTDTMLSTLYRHGLIKIEDSYQQNTLSSHFMISRVFHPTIRPNGGKGKGSELSNFFCQSLAENTGDYSPILFKKFKKTMLSCVKAP